MRKPTPVASHHIHSGRIIDVSTERLRYAQRPRIRPRLRAPPGRRGRGCGGWRRARLRGAPVPARRHRFPVGNPRRQARRRARRRRSARCANWPRKPACPPAAGRRWDFTCRLRAFSRKSSTSTWRAISSSERPRRTPTKNWRFSGCRWREPSDKVLRGEWNDGKTALALWRAQYQLQL